LVQKARHDNDAIGNRWNRDKHRLELSHPNTVFGDFVGFVGSDWAYPSDAVAIVEWCLDGVQKRKHTAFYQE